MTIDRLKRAYDMGPHEFKPDLSGKPLTQFKCAKCGLIRETTVHFGV